MNNTTSAVSPHKILKSVFGYDTFRDQQEEIIGSTLNKKDSLVIMPTGGGKSLCYQVPALCMDGFAIVVSPLIALMQDQVMALRSAGVNAQALNSQLNPDQKRQLMHELEQGEIKLLYISPEVAAQENFINYLTTLNVNLVAIDEAHCVSVWGNDFRPEYAQLDKLIKALPNAAHMALTATADRATQKDISTQLKLNEPKHYLSSFERKNISSSVLPGQGRMKEILNFLAAHPNEAGIIYTLSRKSAEMLAGKLQMEGFNADYYHGSLNTETRNKVQEEFKNDDLQIVCATIAFGMGIDKSNIRWVIHYNLPKNLESYYQEIGRSGRDGTPAETLLFFSYGDAQILRSFIDDSQADDQFKNVQRAKLERMLEYCQATSCRTNVVLSYFGEHKDKPCGRCDICMNPPTRINGTLIAQKVLSGCKRLKEAVPITTLINVLRGAQNQEVLENGFHKIKTYGAVKDIAYFDLFQYITQLINQGFLEIDYTQHNHLKVTKLGDAVLFEAKEVGLTQPIDRKLEKSEKAKKKDRKLDFESSLFEALRAYRKQLAKEAGVPAFVVFSDKTLQEIAADKPLTMGAFSGISGVGEAKLSKYGRKFIDFLQSELVTKKTPVNVKGKTYIETLQLFKAGGTPEEIANQRNLNVGTIYTHLAQLAESGEDIDLDKLINADIKKLVIKSHEELGKPAELKPIFDHLKEKVPYHLIRLALAVR
ncbi:MAG: DNA helicase RecQ [Flavobacteriales bacterium]